MVHGSVHCSRSWSVYVWVACWHNGLSEGWYAKKSPSPSRERQTQSSPNSINVTYQYTFCRRSPKCIPTKETAVAQFEHINKRLRQL